MENRMKGGGGMSERRAGILLSYFNLVLHAAIGFFYVPLLLHFIGKNGYGLYQLMGSLAAYLSVMDFGLSSVVTRFYVKYKALGDGRGMENLLALALRGYLLMEAALLFVGGVVYFFLEELFGASLTAAELAEARPMVLVLLLNVALSLSLAVFNAAIQAHERFAFFNGVVTLQLLAQPAAVVLFLMESPYALTVVIAQTFVSVIFCAARVWYCFSRLHVKIRFHFWDRELFYDFRKLASSVFLVTLVDLIFEKSNHMILGIESGTAAVAVYSVVTLIMMNYRQLSTSVSGVYLPLVTGMVARGESARELDAVMRRVGRWQFYILALAGTGFIIFGRQFIAFWTGAGFEDAYWMTLFIIIPYTVELIQNIGLDILQARNQYGFRAKIYLAAGIFSVVLATALAKRYGGLGCAFATGLAMFLGNGLAMNWFYKNEIGLDIGGFWKEIARIASPVFLCGAGGFWAEALLASPSFLYFLVKIAAYTALYVLVLYHFAMPEEDKEKLRDLMKMHNA